MTSISKLFFLRRFTVLAALHRRRFSLAANSAKVEAFVAAIKEISPQLSERHPESTRFAQILGLYQSWKKELEYVNDLEKLAESSSNEKEMSQMIEEDLEKCSTRIDSLDEKLMKQIVPPDPEEAFDEIIMEFQPGVGGHESMLFALDLFLMYRKYIHFKQIWTISSIEESREEDAGGLKAGSITLSGPGCYKLLRFEGGIHRVQRVPATERKGRPHTSTATVTVLPSPSEIEINLSDKDLRIDVMRASGPGGQHVNKTESAVRVTHLPTGIQSECQEHRSQPENRKTAMARLRARLYELKSDAENAERRGAWKLQVGSRGRSEKIRTYNFMQQRVTDHRVKENFQGADEILKGTDRFDKLIRSLQTHHLRERLTETLNNPPKLEDLVQRI